MATWPGPQNGPYGYGAAGIGPGSTREIVLGGNLCQKRRSIAGSIGPTISPWVRRGSADHTQAHDAAHSDYSRAYGNGQDEDATKGAHSHCTPTLVYAWCGGHAPQALEQWRPLFCP